MKTLIWYDKELHGVNFFWLTVDGQRESDRQTDRQTETQLPKTDECSSLA